MHLHTSSTAVPALDTGSSDFSRVDLIREYKDNPSEAARDSVVLAYLPFVHYHAQRLSDRLPGTAQFDADDLAQEGTCGLLEALENFDPDRGVKFETFCLPRVSGAMLDSLRSYDWVPRLVRQNEKKVKHTIAALTDTLGREPDDQECADSLNKELDEFLVMKADAQVARVNSMESRLRASNYAGGTASEGKEKSLEDTLSEPREKGPLNRLLDEELGREIQRGFNEVERDIFQFYVVEEKTMAQIGELLELSESRVSQMFSRMVERLQQGLLTGLRSNDNSFMSLLARDVIGSDPESEMTFVPLPDDVIRSLDQANALNSVHFDFVSGPTEFGTTDSGEEFVSRLVASARKKQTAPDPAADVPPAGPGDASDDSFGFTFT